METKVISNSPHIKSGNSTRKIMLNVCLALMPACIAGCVFFGWKALMIIALSVVSAVASEVIYLLICKKKFKDIIKNFDCTSVVTGLLLAMALSTQVSWYVPIISAAFAIIVVKMLFGGTGKNIVNPAVTGRIFAFLSFGSVMSLWVMPLVGGTHGEAVTGATSLTNLFEIGKVAITDGDGNIIKTLTNLDLLLGTNLPGCIGETCKIALIAGGIYLMARGIIDYKYPIIYIAVTGLMTVALNGFNFAYFLPSVLGGGLILGALFMATDYTTSPNSLWGNVIYFVFLGVITAVLRQFTKIEVVSFAILLGNLIVPLIDKFVYPRPFGYKRKKKEAK